MHKRMIGTVAAMIAGTLAAGCANDGGLLAGSLTTASVTEQAAASATPQQKVDPQCVALMSKIDQLRKEGTPARIEKISTGKGTTAQVKRESLARITELDKANAEFQSRCSTLSTPQQAAVAPSVTQAAKAETTDTAKATDAAAGAVAGKTAAATASPAQPAAPEAAAATAAKDTVTKPAKKAAKKAAPKSEKTEKAAAAAPAAAPAAEAKPAAAAKTAAVAQPAAAAAAAKPTASFSSATPAVAISAPAVVTTTATKPAE